MSEVLKKKTCDELIVQRYRKKYTKTASHKKVPNCNMSHGEMSLRRNPVTISTCLLAEKKSTTTIKALRRVITYNPASLACAHTPTSFRNVSPHYHFA